MKLKQNGFETISKTFRECHISVSFQLRGQFNKAASSCDLTRESQVRSARPVNRECIAK